MHHFPLAERHLVQSNLCCYPDPHDLGNLDGILNDPGRVNGDHRSGIGNFMEES